MTQFKAHLRLLAAALCCCVSLVQAADTPPASGTAPAAHDTYSDDEVARQASEFFSTGAKDLSQVLEKVLKEKGHPVAIIRGEEAGGAIGVGVRYGRGRAHLQGRRCAQNLLAGSLDRIRCRRQRGQDFYSGLRFAQCGSAVQALSGRRRQSLFRRRLRRQLSAARRRGARTGPLRRRLAAGDQPELHQFPRAPSATTHSRERPP
jgi:hypothetical protein